MNKKIYITSIVILLLDQLSKIIISSSLKLFESKIIINNFFNITYIINKGAAWSILSNYPIILIIISILAFILIIKNIATLKPNNRNNIAVGLLLAGLLGNLIDRVFIGGVRDFLDFRIFGYNYPIFNISDIAIFFGVLLLIIAIFKGEDHEIRSKRK